MSEKESTQTGCGCSSTPDCCTPTCVFGSKAGMLIFVGIMLMACILIAYSLMKQSSDSSGDGKKEQSGEVSFIPSDDIHHCWQTVRPS